MKSFYLILPLIVIWSLSSCLKIEKFPDEPVITYKDLIIYGKDSLNIVLEFTDGDGNLGVSEDASEEEKKSLC